MTKHSIIHIFQIVSNATTFIYNVLPWRNIILRSALCGVLLVCLSPPCLAGDIRRDEIAECRTGELMTWGDGVDHPLGTSQLKFVYLHRNCPAWFSEQQVRKLISAAATAWSQCGIAVQLVPEYAPHTDQILIQWNEKESLGNFALANLTRRTLSLSPKGFALLHSRNPRHDASQTLQMAIAHEMGHFFGLMAHSRRCVDVMSYYHNGRGETCYTRNPGGMTRGIEYRNSLPTACDIKRCRSINGSLPLSKTR